jgi:hypothetical protein
MLYPFLPNGFADHYPYQMAISLGIYPIFRQTQKTQDLFNHYFGTGLNSAKGNLNQPSLRGLFPVGGMVKLI